MVVVTDVVCGRMARVVVVKRQCWWRAVIVASGGEEVCGKCSSRTSRGDGKIVMVVWTPLRRIHFGVTTPGLRIVTRGTELE